MITATAICGSATGIDANAVTDPDSEDFVTADMLIATPGKAVYQAVGHAAIRMRCPSQGLDLVFSFETDLEGGLLGQFSGKSHGKMCVSDPEKYLDDFRSEGRGVSAYRLNLNPKEKRELWRALDNMLLDGEGGFNVRHRGCMSQALLAISQAIFPDRMHHDDSSGNSILNGKYADIHIKPHAPWSNLFIKTGTSSDCDEIDQMSTRLWPVVFEKEYGNVFIISFDGNRRPLVAGQPEILVRQTVADAPQPVTPLMAALAIMAIAVAACALQLAHKGKRIVEIADALLMLIVTLGGIAVLFITYMPNHIGGNWNWNLIVMNPLPCLVWIIWHKRSWFKHVYIVYGIILTMFIAVMPWITTGVDTAMYVVAGAMALRCFVKAFSFQG